ncbi:D-glycero-beta-D-manno-heptose 1,7-bisphosphate 7-phosphatase [Simplicispira psychrophila]|uniref:D-glycero-beta-D-manno-heptose 1,7-bisphosphate 7-phosphatase n=1 Tax=Simplicispira psychrophila TaxID=80882 RepID=UPI00048517B2|nr:D-glycero-beta-D-manno-heptose 1,7-bisphosphate 7-phosphatase [Simplicispira psychrophila]
MKLVILDRDGTINSLADEEAFISSVEEWVPVPGALQAIASLNHAGWRVVLATNQSGLGRGLFDVTTLNAIHALMHKQLAALGGRLDAIFYCPHTAADACNCRKPAPGLMEQICERYRVDPRTVPVIGSCAAHLQAGAAIGAQLHLVDSGQGAAIDPALSLPAGTHRHADLAAAVAYLLASAAALPAGAG